MAVIDSDEALEAFGLRESADDILERFGIAQDHGKPSAAQLQFQATLRDMIGEVAIYANSHITDGRNKSLGLTALEDALLRFGKAIFEIPQ